MTARYRTVLILTSLLLSGAAPVRPVQHPAAVSGLYSARALRRARIILQMRLLELRAARLERVRRAVERHFAADRILQLPP